MDLEQTATSERKPTTAPAMLSKSVMSMKFMKRKADDDGAQQEEVARKKLVTEMIWSSRMDQNKSLASAESPKLVCEIDFSDSLSTYPGRRSFGGFNKAVEQQYNKYLDSLKFDKLASKASSSFDVDDEEMLERYQTLIGLPRGPNQGRLPDDRQRLMNSNKRPKSIS